MTSSQAQTSPGPGQVAHGREPRDQVLAAGIRVGGPATAHDVAAIIAVLAAASGGTDEVGEDPGSPWSSHAAAMRRPVGHAPGTWRSSLRP